MSTCNINVLALSAVSQVSAMDAVSTLTCAANLRCLRRQHRITVDVQDIEARLQEGW